MSYRVEILPTAWEDLKDIQDYYLMQFGEDLALKVSTHILDFIERLEANQYVSYGHFCSTHSI